MKKCLIVDDCRLIRRVSRQIFEDLGFSVEEAENGKVALEVCDAAMPDIVLLDWNMPVMTGIEFLALLRKRPEGTLPKVLFCSSENDLAHIREAIWNGADEYMVKPINREKLHTKLQLVGFVCGVE